MDNKSIQRFLDYCDKHIKGDEKGEAQLFLDHFFVALGYEEGLKSAGADCEVRIKNDKKHTTSFADLVWKPHVLIEMKKRDEDLSKHYQQAFDYWVNLVPDRPQYVVLCNFDEFWIYNLNEKVYEPVTKIGLHELQQQKQAFAFLLPEPEKPQFNVGRFDVTPAVAEDIARIFLMLTKRGIKSEVALRYCMQCVIALFADSVELLPNRLFAGIIEECIEDEKKAYDLIGGLFRAMNEEGIKPAGRYKGVDYFNGGLFSKVEALELWHNEIIRLENCTRRNWSHVNPAIFGSIFESGMDEKERHQLGAHYTVEADIKMIVYPVIVKPWNLKIEAAETLDECYNLLTELRNFKVLDPACGSGNFLFVAYREMKALEQRLLDLIRARTKTREDQRRLTEMFIKQRPVSTKQFFGIDTNAYAVELAKVTLMVAKELVVNKEDSELADKPLPLDNLDKNIIKADALFTDWPEVDAIIGNPPFQSKNKMQDEFGAEYVSKLHTAYPEVPGRADFCVYWFYKAHQHLKDGSYAGLVGTNTIRQNYSREGSLDYIVKHGGTIIEAVSSKNWSGAAVVFVSIVNWKKGKQTGTKILYSENKSGLVPHLLKQINSSLSEHTDVTSAKVLECNKEPKKCFQGQTHGQEGFLLSVKEAKALLKKNKKYSEVLKPFLIGDELVGNLYSQPGRFVIDFSKMDMVTASSYKDPYNILQEKVLPDISKKAELEKSGDIKANGREAWLKMWWKMWRRREDMLDAIHDKSRYIVFTRVSKRQIFEFVVSEINPNDALMVFAFEDDYSFGIIQSNFHWVWILEKCSTLKGDFRYTGESIWDTFPWPQSPTEKQIKAVAKASKELRDYRNQMIEQHRLTLRDLYRTMETPGKNKLKDLHAALDEAVMNAYGFDKTKDVLQQLLDLNLEVAAREKKKQEVQPPGLPSWVKNKEQYVSEDCVRMLGDEVKEGMFKK